MELPISPLDYRNLKTNISYDEIQSLSFEDLSKWVDDLRTELLNIWDTESIPPSIGISEPKIKERFSKLNDYPIDDFVIEDENYPNYLGIIKNFSKVGSGVNQFFPAILKSKVGRGETKPLSMYDFFSDKNLSQDFKFKIVQKVRFDKMYLYTSYLESNNKNNLCFIRHWKKNLDDNIGYFLEPTNSHDLEGNSHKLVIDTDLLKTLQNEGVLSQTDMKNQDGYDVENEMNHYFIRYYDKSTKVFPNIIQILRLGLSQVAVNFNPLTARLIYEKYLKGSENIVFDGCMGWGGRLLGSLSSKRKIHYLGCDVNTENVGSYEKLGEFYNENCGGKNTYEFHYVGAETIHENQDFKKYIGKVDLCFTSPPYYNREIYSMDKEQSCFKYETYQEWKEKFLNQMMKNSYELLKTDGFCIINISDIRFGKNEYITLEQDTISIAKNLNFEYLGKWGMCMVRMIGLSPADTKNYWLEMKSQTTYKIENIFVFQKKVIWPWEE